MQRMTGIDPMFIYSDTPETRWRWPTPASSTRPPPPAATHSSGCVALLESGPALPPFRRRLVPVPLGLDHPRWVDDPDFDLANHLHRVALPGSRR